MIVFCVHPRFYSTDTAWNQSSTQENSEVRLKTSTGYSFFNKQGPKLAQGRGHAQFMFPALICGVMLGYQHAAVAQVNVNTAETFTILPLITAVYTTIQARGHTHALSTNSIMTQHMEVSVAFLMSI